MAVIQTDKETAVKLIGSALGLDGQQHTTTRTFSNIVNGIPDDALYNGMQAVISLLEKVPAEIVRVEEASLSQE